VRVVFDTNIYVSAFVLPGSSADRAMQRIFDGHDTLLISKPMLAVEISHGVRLLSLSAYLRR